MKITKLSATKVHGYLPLDIEFFPDLTFLTGLNGSGKTSALRLLVALLTPIPEEIIAIAFATASVRASEGDREHIITATRTTNGLELSINSIETPLTLSTSELQLLVDARRRQEHARTGRDETLQPIYERISADPVVMAIREIATPMFLGLDRRFFGAVSDQDDPMATHRREYLMRRMLRDDPTLRSGGTAAALADVNYLVSDRQQDIRVATEKLDENLRVNVFQRAFEYKPSGVDRSQLPSRAELERNRALLTKIERAAETLKLPVPEVQSALSDFFSRMSRVVDSLEAAAKLESTRPKKKGRDQWPVNDNDFVEWIVNAPQSARILEHVTLLNNYVDARAELREPIRRFLTLINSFFDQTGKSVFIAEGGELKIHLRSGEVQPITALSSGERQLLMILGHLSLNKHLAVSGVFIVDEPELSLHIDWQERFVRAITEANPKVQLILATHSPAIILDRSDACRSLS